MSQGAFRKNCSPADTLICAQWDLYLSSKLQKYMIIKLCCFKSSSLASFVTAAIGNQYRENKGKLVFVCGPYAPFPVLWFSVFFQGKWKDKDRTTEHIRSLWWLNLALTTMTSLGGLESDPHFRPVTRARENRFPLARPQAKIPPPWPGLGKEMYTGILKVSAQCCSWNSSLADV